jgi:hypothetical protein
MRSLTHFVGFKDDRYTLAVKVFGKPDFIHRYWDGRAKSMVCGDDRVVFAAGSEQDVPKLWSFDDSGVF